MSIFSPWRDVRRLNAQINKLAELIGQHVERHQSLTQIAGDRLVQIRDLENKLATLDRRVMYQKDEIMRLNDELANAHRRDPKTGRILPAAKAARAPDSASAVKPA